LWCLDSDASMTPRVTDKRDEENFRRQAVEVAYCLEAEPRFAPGRIVLPVFDLVPLFWTIAPCCDEAAPILRGLHLSLHYMYDRLREIFQTASMIEIEVGQYNMTHLACGKSKPLNLSDRRVFLIKL